eukprot:scaffold1437_cov112-Skeletonema_dohrnii-CCMP3373.AAC.3
MTAVGNRVRTSRGSGGRLTITIYPPAYALALQISYWHSEAEGAVAVDLIVEGTIRPSSSCLYA